MAIWGLHSRPKRNWVTCITWKNRIASYSTESTMPTVVKIAMVEQAMRSTLTTVSTWFRALSSGEIRLRTLGQARSQSEFEDLVLLDLSLDHGYGGGAHGLALGPLAVAGIRAVRYARAARCARAARHTRASSDGVGSSLVRRLRARITRGE